MASSRFTALDTLYTKVILLLRKYKCAQHILQNNSTRTLTSSLGNEILRNIVESNKNKYRHSTFYPMVA